MKRQQSTFIYDRIAVRRNVIIRYYLHAWLAFFNMQLDH